MKYIPYIFLFIFLFFTHCQNLPKNVPAIGFLDAFEDETIAQAKQGFFDALSEAGFSEADSTLRVYYFNAQGDLPTLVQSTDYLISKKVKLIATNPTTSAITAVQKTSKTPVCMMVSSEPSLINLTDKKGNPPPNLFGVYDNLDYIATSVGMIKELIPQAKRVGVIYNQAEPQSQNALKTIEEKAKSLGLEIVSRPVVNTSDTQLIVESLLNEGVDAFFAMPDNIVFASFEVIYKVCQASRVPIFTSEEGLVKRGSIAAYGADIYQWGYQAGKQAAQYLENPAKGLPQLEKVKVYQKIYNPQEAQNLQVTFDDSFTAINQNSVPTSPKETHDDGRYTNFYLAALMLGLGFAALGMGIYISMRIFNIPDITTDGSYTLGGSITAILLSQNLPLPLIVLATLAGGILAGVCTGIIHAKLKVNALLSGILVMTGLYSINLMIMGKSNIPLIDKANLLDLLGPQLGSFLSELSILLLITFLLWLLLSYLLRTDFGLAMRATGNSESMIRANGVDTDWMKIMGLGISNAFVALSGFLIVQYQGFADINMGIGIVIIGLGSVMIGETLSNWLGFQKIQYRILGVIVGTLLFRLILAFSLSIGIHPNSLRLVTALLVLIVVAFPNIGKNLRSS